MNCAESSSDCGQFEPPPPSWWQRVADIQTDGSDVDPFLFKMDGVTCTAHTQRGRRKKRSDKSEVCHMLWRMERKVSIEDGFAADVEFMETASAYSVLDNWAPCTAVGQLLVFLVVGPTVLGFPIIRNRCLAASINLSRRVWCGPRTTHGIAEDFVRLWGRKVVSTGTIYMEASEHEVNSYALELADDRKTQLPDNFESLPMVDCLHHLVPLSNRNSFKHHLCKFRSIRRCQSAGRFQ